MIISYETAKLAKEKGFDEYVTSYYYPSAYQNRLISQSALDANEDFYDDCPEDQPLQPYKYNSHHPEADFYSAPIQSRLQKWLREEHLLYVYIRSTSLGDYAPHIEDPYGKQIYDPWENENKGISYTYEEALEEGLQIALNLIK